MEEEFGKTAFYDAPDFVEWCFKCAEKYFPANQQIKMPFIFIASAKNPFAAPWSGEFSGTDVFRASIMPRSNGKYYLILNSNTFSC